MTSIDQDTAEATVLCIHSMLANPGTHFSLEVLQSIDSSITDQWRLEMLSKFRPILRVNFYKPTNTFSQLHIWYEIDGYDFDKLTLSFYYEDEDDDFIFSSNNYTISYGDDFHHSQFPINDTGNTENRDITKSHRIAYHTVIEIANLLSRIADNPTGILHQSHLDPRKHIGMPAPSQALAPTQALLRLINIVESLASRRLSN